MLNNTSATKNVVIYACIYNGRYYKGKTQLSVDEQLKACREFAERNNLNVVGEYREKTRFSWKGIKRPQYSNMIEEHKDTQFQSILIYSWGRLYVDSLKYMFGKAQLIERGISILQARVKI